MFVHWLIKILKFFCDTYITWVFYIITVIFYIGTHDLYTNSNIVKGLTYTQIIHFTLDDRYKFT